MNIKLKMRPTNWPCAIFIFDCAVMPVVKILGFSIKISYGIAFLSILFMLMDWISRKRLTLGGAQPVLTSLFAYTALLCFGEFWSALIYGVSARTTFFKILIGTILMIGSVHYGYTCRGRARMAAYWSFVANVVINCTLALLGRSAPSFMVKLYSVSVDTFIDGYYRNGGIIGNPNSSLLITNMILLLVVLLYRYDKLKLSNLKLASLYLLSIAADIIVSSRGELLHSLLILAYLTVWIVKKNNTTIKLLKKIIPIAVIIVLAVGLLWGSLVQRYPNIQISLDRMDTITDIFDAEHDDTGTESISRPFLRADVFWNRFRHSPLWGTGISGNGRTEDFYKGTTGYHNDFFLILGATGILGFLLWIRIIKTAVTKVGICMLFPFMIAAISNTFVQSYFGMMLYFFIIGYILRFSDEKEHPPVSSGKRNV